MKDVTCDFCKPEIVLAQSDGAVLCITNVLGNTVRLRLKKPQRYFPLECGKCGEITRWWGKIEL